MRQQSRLTIGVAYAVLLMLLVSTTVNSTLVPPFSSQGLWYYTGFLPLLIARFIVEPYFSRPADALANSMALLVAVVTLTPGQSTVSAELITTGRISLAVFAVIVLTFAVVAMMGRDTSSPVYDYGPRATRLSGWLGRGDVVFSLNLVLVSWIAFADVQQSLWLIAAAWLVVVVMRPLERIAPVLNEFRQVRPSSTDLAAASMIDPSLVVASLASSSASRLGNRVQWESGAEGTVVDHTTIQSRRTAIVALDKPAPIAEAERGRLTGERHEAVVGYVTDGTTTTELVLRVSPAVTRELEVGRLLRTRVHGVATLHQVVDARLVERGEAGLRRQFVEVRARKLGQWDDVEGRFVQIPWLPDAGTQVELVRESVDDGIISGIGRVPGTDYEIGLQVPALVTHNTAILGILGVGKTSLAWELVERMVLEGIRVIVLDITGEYAFRFSRYFDDSEARWMYERMEEFLAPGRANASPPKATAGNVSSLKPAFTEVLRSFAAAPSSVLVINPAALDVTIEDGAAWSNVVPLRRLTVPEVTQHLAEAILEFAQGLWPADPSGPTTARICVVLEEAHTLVPEGGSSSGSFADAGAASKTARAVLQGRKFGVGCLLITQRTANVTKTILNQCHTVFAMRCFDATSEQFLSNYIGVDYASLLSEVPERHAVLFGRGSTSQAPVLIRLNDRGDFREQWQERLDGVPVTRLRPIVADGDIDGDGPAPPVETEPEVDEFEDLPF